MANKMKVLVVGDIHGRWELANKAFDICLKQGYDKIIFIGDLLDSWDRPDGDIIRTVNICTGMKESYPDLVELLVGNHDEQYFHHDVSHGIKCTGFRPKLHRALSHVMIAKRSLFTYAYGINNYLFTHAGINQAWFIKHFDTLDGWAQKMDIDLTDITQLWVVLHNLAYTKDKHVLREIGSIRGGYDSGIGGPLWCDKTELFNHGPIVGLNQVVGHTAQHFISRAVMFADGKREDNTSVTYIDCLDHRHQFLTLEIDV